MFRTRDPFRDSSCTIPKMLEAPRSQRSNPGQWPGNKFAVVYQRTFDPATGIGPLWITPHFNDFNELAPVASDGVPAVVEEIAFESNNLRESRPKRASVQDAQGRQGPAAGAGPPPTIRVWAAREPASSLRR